MQEEHGRETGRSKKDDEDRKKGRERERVKDGTRQSGKIESAGWGRYVVCSGQYGFSPPPWPRRAPS